MNEFRANANILPTIFWCIIEAIKDRALKDRLMSEVSQCTGTEDEALDISKLCAQPLLQSTHAEVLRLRVAIASKQSPLSLPIVSMKMLESVKFKVLSH